MTKPLRVLSENTLIVLGALLILFSDVVLVSHIFPAPPDQFHGLRLIGVTVFVIGLMIKLIIIDHRTQQAKEVHDALWAEISELKNEERQTVIAEIHRKWLERDGR